MFRIQEFNDCGLIELIPSSVVSGPNTASVYEYYISITAVETQGEVNATDWLSLELKDIFALPDVSQHLRKRQISVGEIQGIEIGPIPGQVDQNVVVISSPSVLLEIIMYPAPTQLGGDTLPPGSWHEAQVPFPSTFYRILETLRLSP